MQEFHLKIGENGEIALPATLREELSVKTGDEIVISGVPHDMRIYRSPDVARRMNALRELQQMFQAVVPPNVSLVDELIADRRAEAAREEAEYQQHYSPGAASDNDA